LQPMCIRRAAAAAPRGGQSVYLHFKKSQYQYTMRSSALTVLASASAVSAWGIYPRPTWSEHPHPTFSYPGPHHSSATSSASSSATSTAPVVAPTGAAAWKESQFDSLIAFGDSYTDESRLGYFINHKGAAPPVGYLGPESLSASDGGRIWARYVVQYSDEKINLYNYAVSGAVCSNEITPRWFSAINADFPDLNGYEVPAFLADKAYDINSATNETLFSPALTADNTVYAICMLIPTFQCIYMLIHYTRGRHQRPRLLHLHRR